MLLAKITELEKVIQQQAASIAEVEKRLHNNSSNRVDARPSDGLGKPPGTRSLRENGKRTNAGQQGHQEKTLKQIESPDIINKHVDLTCPDCHSSLTASPVIGIMKRSVVAIPPPKLEVAEHQAEVKHCECCKTTITRAFTAAVLAPAQYVSSFVASLFWITTWGVTVSFILSDLA